MWSLEQKNQKTYSPVLAWEHRVRLAILFANAPHCSAPGFEEVRLLLTMVTWVYSLVLQSGRKVRVSQTALQKDGNQLVPNSAHVVIGQDG